MVPSCSHRGVLHAAQAHVPDAFHRPVVVDVLIPLNDALASLARSYDAEFALSLPPLWMLATAVVSVAVLGALSARWSVQRNTKF